MKYNLFWEPPRISSEGQCRLQASRTQSRGSTAEKPPAPNIESTASMFSARNIQITDGTRAIATGGIGAIQLLAQEVGLVDAIKREVHL